MRKITDTWQFKAGVTAAGTTVVGLLMSTYISILQDYNDRKAKEAEEEKAKAELIIQAQAPAPKPNPLTAPDSAMPIVKAAPKKKAEQKLVLTPEVHQALTKVSKKTGIPLAAMIALCERESTCKAEAVQPKTKACGLYQFMTNDVETLYETLWRFGTKAGYQAERNLVMRYERNAEERKDKKTIPVKYGYKPVDDEAREKLASRCLDPEFNATLWAHMTMPKIDSYETWLNTGRKATVGEIVLMNNLGDKGLQVFTTQAWADSKAKKQNPQHKEMLSADFFEAHKRLFGGNVGANNRTLIKNSQGELISVRAAYNQNMNKHGGWGSFQLAAPEPNI